jgi:hypothetical protein
MAKQEIEYEKTELVTEEVTICDKCDREVDDAGREFHPPNYATKGGPTLHFCSECLNKMTQNEQIPHDIIQADKWVNNTF